MSVSIDFKRYSADARVPLRQTSDSAGHDLYSAEDEFTKVCSRELARLDFEMAIPDGYYGRIVGRSGLALKCGLLFYSGTNDLDYGGVVWVILFNFSDVDYKIEKGNRIVQLIIEGYYEPKFIEVLELSD